MSTTMTTHQRAVQLILKNRIAEDPNREPHEKETATHTEGDGNRFSITSFKKVVFEKLLQHPEFDLECLNVIDENNRESTVNSYNELLENPTLTVIGAKGTIPVGCLSIGAARNSDSHAQIVKK